MKTWPVFAQHKTKVVKIRESRRCFLLAESGSGLYMDKGSEMLSVTILPNTPTGQLWNLKKPFRTWFCGECPLCRSEWAKHNELKEGM